MASKLNDDSNHKFQLSQLPNDSRLILLPIQGFDKEPLVTLEKAVELLTNQVPQLNHMIATVKQNIEKPNDSLTINESAAIRLYTLGWKTLQSSFHYILNKTLRNENRKELIPWYSYLRLFLHALSKLPATEKQIFFCGTKTDVSHEYPEDRVFVWWDFISCTSNIKLLENSVDVRTIFIIETNSAKYISEHSYYESENEYLLYPARQFQTISSYNSNKHLSIIHLKEIVPSTPLISIPQVTTSLKTTKKVSYQNDELEIVINNMPKNGPIALQNQNLHDVDMDIIVKQAIITKQCRELWLQSNKITSIGVSVIANALNNNKTLQVLILHDNQLSDVGVVALANVLALNNSAIKVLGLESTGVTDEGAKHLAEMLKTNKTVTSLGLGENFIGDRGLQALVDVLNRQNNNLQELYVPKNRTISDICIDFIVQMLKNNRTLTRLWIDGCNLSSKGKDRLRQAAHSRNRFSLSV